MTPAPVKAAGREARGPPGSPPGDRWWEKSVKQLQQGIAGHATPKAPSLPKAPPSAMGIFALGPEGLPLLKEEPPPPPRRGRRGSPVPSSGYEVPTKAPPGQAPKASRYDEGIQASPLPPHLAAALRAEAEAEDEGVEEDAEAEAEHQRVRTPSPVHSPRQRQEQMPVQLQQPQQPQQQLQQLQEHYRARGDAVHQRGAEQQQMAQAQGYVYTVPAMSAVPAMSWTPQNMYQEAFPAAYPVDMKLLTDEVEYIFSDESLGSDTYTRSLMMPTAGWVPMCHLVDYPRLPRQ